MVRWLNNYAQDFLSQGYLIGNQTVEERIDEIGRKAKEILVASLEKNEDIPRFLDDFDVKLSTYIKRGWISPSTPIWSNFGLKRGLPISCFNSHIPDSIEGILGGVAETGTMSKWGGGTSIYMGKVRGKGAPISGNGFSRGSKSFLPLFQSTSDVISQGQARRGYLAAYTDIYHPDIEDWLRIRGEGDSIQEINWGVCVPDWWMQDMRNGDVQKRTLWAKIIQKRFETGLPYLFFNKNANDGQSVPEVYKGKDLIKSSNLCNEIMLPSTEDESFVCNLASLNDHYFEEWKETDCVKVITFFLDAVMSSFISQTRNIKYMERTVKFAENHRAIGIGRLGYHSFLQSKQIAFDSLHARIWNMRIQETIYKKAYEASGELAILYGEPTVLQGVGRRNTTLIALPPTTSTAFIMQESQSIEPWMNNYMVKSLAKGKYVIKNKYLEKLLVEKGQNTEEVWENIQMNLGSVQNLPFLSAEEKAVFKTAREISQDEIIIQAAQRQRYIDQGQSLNLFTSPSTTAKEVNSWILKAYDSGLKGLYYQHNFNGALRLTKELFCSSCSG